MNCAVYNFNCLVRPALSPFSTLLFRCRRRKIMTAKLCFCVPSPLKKLVLALQSSKMSCFYFTFCSWSYKTNKVSGWRNFSPATAKYVSGKRALESLSKVFFWCHRGFANPSINLYLPDCVHVNTQGQYVLYRSYRGAILKALYMLSISC